MEYKTQTKRDSNSYSLYHNNDPTISFDLNAIEVNNQDVRPKTMLLNAIASCTGSTVMDILKKKHKVPFNSFSINVSGDLTGDHPIVFKKIHILYIIEMDPKEKEKEKVRHAVHLATTKYCGVQAMLSKTAIITSEIIFL